MKPLALITACLVSLHKSQLDSAIFGGVVYSPIVFEEIKNTLEEHMKLKRDMAKKNYLHLMPTYNKGKK